MPARTLAPLFLVLALAGCGEAPPAVYEGRPGGPYRMTLELAPDPPVPGTPATLTTRLRHAADARPVRDLQVVHERVVHNFIVARDFTSFAHIHHEDFGPLTAADLAAATFSFPYTFPRAGHYRMGSEFTHRDRAWTRHFDFVVGAAPPPPAPRVDLARSRRFGEFAATLHTSPRMPVAGFESEIVLELARDGEPVTDLALLLGSEVHVALWRLDGEHFGHAHSYTPHMAAMMDAMHDRAADAATRDARMSELMVAMIDMPAELVFPGPRVPVRLVFPAPGIYAVFLHCAPGGTPQVFDFQLDVIAHAAGVDTRIDAMRLPPPSHRGH
ncbi:MAG: hypothetical protein RLW62_05220 [Gammaproteobacteria bacterium]